MLVIARACEKISMTVFLELPTKKKQKTYLLYQIYSKQKEHFEWLSERVILYLFQCKHITLDALQNKRKHVCFVEWKTPVPVTDLVLSSLLA